MNKGVVIRIIIIVIIGTIAAYSIINQNSNTANKIITPDVIPKKIGTNYTVNLNEGITMTGP